MLRPFEIHEPTTVAEACRVLDAFGDDATCYAGGTELIPVMKDGLAYCGHLVDLKTIPGLDTIEVGDTALRIGALATHRRIETSPVVRAHAPLLALVASQVANLRVRCAGTLGGNLCFAEPHSDPAAVLLACGATVVLARHDSDRHVPIDQFFTGILQTARTPDEILTRVDVPVSGPGVGAAYERFATHERPTVGVAALLAIRNGTIMKAGVVVGSVGPIPTRVPEAEAVLSGEAPEQSAFDSAARAAAKAAEVLEDLYGSVDYKRHIVAVLAGRALRRAAAIAGVVT